MRAATGASCLNAHALHGGEDLALTSLWLLLILCIASAAAACIAWAVAAYARSRGQGGAALAQTPWGPFLTFESQGAPRPLPHMAGPQLLQLSSCSTNTDSSSAYEPLNS
ncbi:hypothetical protein cyc_08158 [Cyclospora cayetanensis]|uniref:Uncharacterized protein n=1 Tax=Cyclospora cayetanensis TaxID=88456 RepID=A0A1D3D7T5_9EIME|nr:hypothetical protein cyc_08158 [Cyclospora cayetanensis]